MQLGIGFAREIWQNALKIGRTLDVDFACFCSRIQNYAQAFRLSYVTKTWDGEVLPAFVNGRQQAIVHVAFCSEREGKVQS